MTANGKHAPRISHITPLAASAGSKIELQFENVKDLSKVTVYFQGPDYNLIKASKTEVVNKSILKVTVPKQALSGLLIGEINEKKFQSYEDFTVSSKSKLECTLASKIVTEDGRPVRIVSLTKSGDVGIVRLNKKWVPLKKNEFRFEASMPLFYFADVEGAGESARCEIKVEPPTVLQAKAEEANEEMEVSYCGDGMVQEHENCDEGMSNGTTRSLCSRDCKLDMQ